MTANMMHLLRLTFRFQLSSGKTILSAVFRVKLESDMRLRQTQSAFHRRAQRNAFRRRNRSTERIAKAANAICLKDYSSFLRSKEAPA